MEINTAEQIRHNPSGFRLLLNANSGRPSRFFAGGQCSERWFMRDNHPVRGDNALKMAPGNGHHSADRLSLAAGERWYAVYSQPHREFRAQQQLNAQGFTVFLPLYRKTVRHARKLRTVNAPFFPRYLFVALDLSCDQWRCVNGTFGVTSLLTDGAMPRPVPHGVVESLVHASEEGCLQFGKDLKVGDSVRVLTGPFANLLGELARIDGAGRVRVLLQLLGGVIPASIDRRDLILTHAA